MQESNRGDARKRYALNYPPHWFKPEELLTFIEHPPFQRRWQELELTDRDLALLQVAFMANPKMGDVVKGTGGLRKLLFAPGQRDKGKRGALRACYKHVESVGTIILALVYTKADKDDLSAKEKRILKALITEVENLLLARPYRSTAGKLGKQRSSQKGGDNG